MVDGCLPGQDENRLIESGVTHNLFGKAFQYHNIILAMDETFTLPGYISGLIYDLASRLKHFAFILQTLVVWW